MPTKTLIFITLLLLISRGFAAPALDVATGGEPNPHRQNLEGYHSILALFSELDYTPETWLEGDRSVPRIYLAEIPKRWGSKTSKEVTVQLKKQLFFRLLGPLVLRSNELILQDREALVVLNQTSEIIPQQQEWLTQLANQYGVSVEVNDPQAAIAPLLERVDALPASLILAQAAEESGWGTSRFAFAGNALFGQWTWSGPGITPKEQRSGKGDYKIAAFESPLQSVRAHALNLNTHHAYQEFRDLRARYRAQGDTLSGIDAANTLTHYSERGTDYVKTLHSIIRYNKLQPADKAQLSDMQALVILPAGSN